MEIKTDLLNKLKQTTKFSTTKSGDLKTAYFELKVTKLADLDRLYAQLKIDRNFVNLMYAPSKGGGIANSSPNNINLNDNLINLNGTIFNLSNRILDGLYSNANNKKKRTYFVSCC